MKGPRFMRVLLSNVRKRICIISQSGSHIYNFVHIMCKNGRHGHDKKNTNDYRMKNRKNHE